jgi:hypothetical protein
MVKLCVEYLWVLYPPSEDIKRRKEACVIIDIIGCNFLMFDSDTSIHEELR